MLSVKGRFVDGVALPNESVEGYNQEEVIIIFLRSNEEAEREDFAYFRALALPTLQEYWINEEDAVYDGM